MSVSDVRRGVTVRWVDRHGDDHLYEYPSAMSIDVMEDGYLAVIGAEGVPYAVHAPGRWDSAVKHPEAEAEAEVVDAPVLDEWQRLPTGEEIEASLRELQATLERLPKIWAFIPRSFPSIDTGAIRRSLERLYAQVKDR